MTQEGDNLIELTLHRCLQILNSDRVSDGAVLKIQENERIIGAFRELCVYNRHPGHVSTIFEPRWPSKTSFGPGNPRCPRTSVKLSRFRISSARN